MRDPRLPIHLKTNSSILGGERLQRHNSHPACEQTTPAVGRATPHMTGNGRQLAVKPSPHSGDWNDLLREIRSL